MDPATVDWIELVLGMACNCRCQHCPSARLEDPGGQMGGAEIARRLRQGRELGASGVWFGGGEPTLHPKLASAAGRARSLGYTRIRLQTNALRLAYQGYADRLVRAGLSEASVPILGAGEEAHDAMARYPGAHELMRGGVRNLLRLGAKVEGDILISRSSHQALDAALDAWAGQGLGAFTFWLVSRHGLDDEQGIGLLPTMTEAMPSLVRALERADALGLDAATLHTPPCVLPGELRSRYRHAGQWNLLVVTPGGEPFRAEASPMEGGVYLEGCAGCSWRGRCLGLRRDYLDVHGGEEFRPVT